MCLEASRRNVDHAGTQERDHVVGGDRPAEEETLGVRAAEPTERLGLCLRLDAFGDGPDAELARQSDHRGHERPTRTAGGVEVLDELAIDLEPVDREIDEVAHRCVGGAEIVDEHPEPTLAEGLEAPAYGLGIANQLRLRKLHGDPPDAHPGSRHRRRDVAGEPRVRELARGHVDVDHERTAQQALVLPGAGLADRLPEDPAAKRNDEARLLGQADERSREQQAARRVGPADQGLEPDDPAAR